MRCLFFLLSLHIVYRSIMPAKGQCTVSTCSDYSTGSNNYLIELLEGCYKNNKDSLKGYDQNLQPVNRNMPNGTDGIIYKSLSNTEERIKASVESHDQKVLTAHQSMASAIASIQSRMVITEQSIIEKIQSHDLSLQRLDQKISTEVGRIDGRLQSLLQKVEEIYQRVNKNVCPYGFEYMADIDQCLHLNLELMTWDNARRACARFQTGAQMVAITDSAKQEAVRRYLQNQFTKPEGAACALSVWTPGGKVAWISGQTQYSHRCHTPYFWKPAPSVETPFTYSNWIPEMPDCWNNMENCVLIASGQGYRWNDGSCDILSCSVCEL